MNLISDTNFTVPTLLHLKGVHMEDCEDVADVFEAQLLEESLDNMTISSKNKCIYDKIPSKFTTIESWPTKTNLRCWHCTLEHSNVPVFIPDRISTMDNTIIVLGSYCSFSCAAADIPRHFPERVWTITETLKIVYERFYKRKVADMPKSPDRKELELYGGTMTVQQYVEEVTKLTKKIQEESNELA